MAGHQTDPVHGAAAPRRRKRWLRWSAAGLLGFFGAILGICGGVAVRLSLGPLDLGFAATQLASGIAAALGSGHEVRIGGIGIEWADGIPRVTVRDLAVLRADGAPVVTARRAYVGLDPLALLRGQIEPVALEAREPLIGLTIRPDGTVAGGGPDVANERMRPSPAFALLDPDIIGRALGSDAVPVGGGMALRRLELVDVTVAIQDERTGAARTFDHFDVTVGQTGVAGVQVQITSEGVRGRWRLAASLGDAVAGRRPLRLAADGVTGADLAGADAGSLAGIILGLELEGSLGVAANDIGPLRGVFDISGSGMVEGPGWQAAIAPARIRLALTPDQRLLEIAPSSVRLGPIGGRLSGRAILPGPAEARVVRLAAALDDLVVDAQGGVPELRRMEVAAVYEMPTRALRIEQALARGPDPAAAPVARAEGIVSFVGATPAVDLRAEGTDVSAASAKRLWPNFVAREAQEWFADNVLGGQLERGTVVLAIPPGFLDGRPLRREMYEGTFVIRDGSVRVAPELPPVQGLSGTVRSTGESVEVVAEGGRIESAAGTVLVPAIRFTGDDLVARSSPGQLEAQAQGPAAALLALGEAQGLSVTRGGGFDTRALGGEGTAAIRAAIPFAPGPDGRPQPPVVRVEAELRNVSGRGVVEGRDLERGAFRLTAEGDGFAVEGTAAVAGLPVRVAARQEGRNRRLVLRAEADTDDASRARLGLAFAPALTGPVPVRFLREQSGQEVTRRVEADLTQARVQLPAVAFDKPRGTPATLQVNLRGRTAVTGLDDIVFQGRGFAVRGRARLAEDGTPALVELSEVRLRPDEQVAARIERGSDGRLGIRITGRMLDLRPILRNLLAEGEDEGAAGSGRVDVSVRVDRALGQNNTAISDLRLDIGRTGARLTDFNLGGSFGGATRVAGQVLSDRGRPYLFVTSTDGGAVMRFMDFYKNMRGGRLTLTHTLTDPSGRRGDGVLFVENFRVTNDRGLERLFGAAPPDRDGRRLSVSGDVAFDRVRAAFTRTPGVLHLTEGVLRNANVGLTFEGRLDTRRQVVDMRGTFIPAFALNNALARIPVVGAFMGGSEEGLIGVTYAVQGPLADPRMQINPASAIAPGIFRRIFAFPDAPAAPGRSADAPAGSGRAAPVARQDPAENGR